MEARARQFPGDIGCGPYRRVAVGQLFQLPSYPNYLQFPLGAHLSPSPFPYVRATSLLISRTRDPSPYTFRDTLRSIYAKFAFLRILSARISVNLSRVLLGGHYMEHRRVLFSNWLIAKHPPHSNAYTQAV